jgi:hypothetical protein
MKALLLVSVVLFTACTHVNKATFAIEPQRPAPAEEVLRGIEDYFTTLGIKLERKTEFIYPETRKESTYFLGRSVGPMPLHSSYHHVVLRLEQSGRLYIDWVETSDVRRAPRPESLAATHGRIAGDLKDRLGVEVVFRYVEQE